MSAGGRPRGWLAAVVAGVASWGSASCGDGNESTATATTAGAPADAPSAPAGSEYTDDGPYLFRDATEEAGLAGFVQVSGDPEKPFIVETVGGGCALFDAEGDGDLDAYLTNGGKLGAPIAENPSDALYVNDGRGRFEDRSQSAGIDERRWTNGVRVADVDADGANDLYLTNYGPDVFYRNRGDGRFEDATEAAGLGDPRWSTGACFLDHDQDGDLDLYVANYVEFDEPKMLAERPSIVYRGISVMMGPRGLPGACDVFYVNDGQGHFRDVTAEVGIQEDLFGFQSVAFDFDQDGWIDVFVGNDSVGNLLWRNLAGKRFEDVAVRQGVFVSLSGRAQACMGVTLGDCDGDQLPDIYVTNFADDYSTLFKNQGRGFFLDATQRLGLATPTMDKLAWGCGFEDFDSDGDVEIYAVNGHVYPQVDRLRLGTEYRQPPQLFERDGERFREPHGKGGPAFAAKRSGRGSAVGDVDSDGDLDLLIENIDGPPNLLRNDGKSGRWIKVLLVGAGENREAVGARFTVESGGKKQLRLVSTASGFLSSSDRRVHVGLGDTERVDALEVSWPSGRSERFEDLPALSLVTIEESADEEPSRLSVVPWAAR